MPTRQEKIDYLIASSLPYTVEQLNPMTDDEIDFLYNQQLVYEMATGTQPPLPPTPADPYLDFYQTQILPVLEDMRDSLALIATNTTP